MHLISRPLLVAGLVAVVAALGLVVTMRGNMPVTLDGPISVTQAVDLTAAGADVTVELTVDEEGFHPAFVRVAPGANVTVSVHNADDVEHAWVSENDLLSLDEHVAPGDTITVWQTFAMPDGQAVRFYDHDHVADGFQGAIYTEPGQPLVPGDEPLTNAVSD